LGNKGTDKTIMAEPTPPEGTDPEVLEDKITKMLSENGNMPREERDKITALVLLDIRSDVKEIKKMAKTNQKEIATLKKKNLILWIENHPKITRTTASVVSLSYLALLVTHFDEIIRWAETALGHIVKFL
jgi:hypothetical protein